MLLIEVILLILGLLLILLAALGVAAGRFSLFAFGVFFTLTAFALHTFVGA